MIEDVADLRRGSYGRHHGVHRHGAGPFRHLAAQVRQVAVIGGTGATVLARHLARALDAGLLGLGEAGHAGAFEAEAKAAQICPVRWRTLAAAPAIDDLQTADFVVTDDLACAHRLCTLRPTLFSRPTPRAGSIGTDVLIVWDGSDAARRAVQAARPLLRDARHVRVLAVCGSDPAVAQDILAEHGVLASTGMEADPKALAECVQREVAAHGIDLLVSGRAAHGSWPEWADPLPYPACAVFVA